jgi:hypothetical protein
MGSYFAIILVILFSAAPLLHADNAQNWDAALQSRQQGYAFQSGNTAFDIFSYNDNGHILEQGFDCKVLKDGYTAVDFAVSRYNQISLVSPSWLSKLDYSFKMQPGKYVQFTGTQGIGYFMLPSELSVTPRYINTPYDLNYVLLKCDYKFSNPEIISLDSDGKMTAVWEAGFKGITSTDKKLILMDFDGSFSYARIYSSASARRELDGSAALTVGYNSAVQASNSMLALPLQNHELFFGVSGNLLSPLSAGITAFSPLMYQIYRDNYLYQDRRIEGNIDYPLAKAAKLGVRAVWEADSLYYFFNTSYNFGKIRAVCNYSKNLSDTAFNIGIEMGLGSPPPVEFREYNYQNIPPAPYNYTTPVVPANNLPPAGAGFTSAVASLDTPEKIAAFDGARLNYLDTHNNGSGYIDGWYSAQQVYNLHGGNCIEQMNFESYVLRQHGYQSYILGFVTPRVSHAMCVYQDKSSGKWNVIDYDRIILSQSGSPEGAIKNIYSNWFLVELIDPATYTPVKQVDSMTRWMLTDWFEKR